ncbi:hypothetical protein AVEN_158073-1 [Araneus ventricosus]|uniref:Uncharacterized protein n=1 Tax=Araneus ventricosus TaxID=182803 RepID=A0A4Y2H0Q9_ARAVE|nr:hypothetical protein AVEN_158073-1 [Araneus ventricosus]
MYLGAVIRRRWRHLRPPSPGVYAPPAPGFLSHVRCGARRAYKQVGSSVESGFGHGAFRLRGRKLTITPTPPK